MSSPASRPPNLPLSDSRTHGHLTDALASAGVTALRLLWFAQQADVEGRPADARRFRSTADDVTSNAFGLLEHLADVGDPLTGLPIDDTDEHLAAGVAGERLAGDALAAAASTARDEGFADVADWFVTLSEAAERHASKLSSPNDGS
jgi:rubrerythrin